MDTSQVYQPIPVEPCIDGIIFHQYESEAEINEFKEINDSMLSEAYSVYTYHYFVSQNPNITFSARNDKGEMVGLCICKMDKTEKRPTGYIGMLSVLPEYRGRGIAKALAIRCINEMIHQKYSECILETEVDNYGALHLYENLGFRRTEYLSRYYLNGNGAYRLILQLEEIFFPSIPEYWQ